MKLQEIHFKRPVKIVTVFSNVHIYGKASKSFNDRKDDTTWREIASKSGYIKDGELYLPETILDDVNFANCALITIEDDNPPAASTNEFRTASSARSKNTAETNHCFHLHHPNKLRIFEIKYNGELELFLNYGYFEVGTPGRANFKLCTLTKNDPVEIKINGKTDFSMASRRERVFKEQFYILEYAGDFDSCKILKDPFDAVKKQVPAKRKVVDLLKPLW